MPVLVNRKELRENVIHKIARTDFIAIRYSAGEVDSWVGFDWTAWVAYRTALRDIISIIESETGTEMNADLLPWATRPLVPVLDATKSEEETEEHRARMLEEYNKELPNPY